MTIPPQQNPAPPRIRIPRQGLGDPRDARQLEKDQVIARRQLGLLSDEQAHKRIHEILKQLQWGQDVSTEADRVPFDIWQDGSPDHAFALVAKGMLVVQDNPTIASVAKDELTKAGYRIVEPDVNDKELVPGDAPRTLRYISTVPRTPSDLAASAHRLQAFGVIASLDYVVPLGHIVKGDDFPEVAAKGYAKHPTHGRRPPQIPPRRVRVAVIDTGIAKPKREDGWLVNVTRGPANIDGGDIMPPVGRLDWFAGHGTFTAGVVQQVAPHCEIYAYRFTTGDGIGTERDVADAILRAVEEADKDGVEDLIINLSVGTPAVTGNPPLAMQQAVDYVSQTHPRVVMVASAGNNGTGERMYPAAFAQVVAVGALTANPDPAKRLPAAFSSYGPWVDCSCVGVGVVSTFVEGTLPPLPIVNRTDAVFPVKNPFGVWSGTSFCAPQISGAIARACQENDVSPDQALAGLLAGRNAITNFGAVIDELLEGTPL
jgi:thermitase